jgi:energy-coupling factor transporter transmembrane protein EcfT
LHQHAALGTAGYSFLFNSLYFSVFFLRLALIFTVSLLVFAPITGYIAYNYGRSFWRWFAFGLLLPFFSVFVALFMAMRDRWAEDKATDPRRRTPPTA